MLWALSSNKAEVIRDLANRSLLVNIRKHPKGFKFKQFPEGDLLAHGKANQDYYLSCILAVQRTIAVVLEGLVLGTKRIAVLRVLVEKVVLVVQG